MKNLISLAALTLTTLTLATTPALATSTSFASLASLSYQLYDLDAFDGVDATISFIGRDYSTSVYTPIAQFSDAGNSDLTTSTASTGIGASASVTNTNGVGTNWLGEFSASATSSGFEGAYGYATFLGAFTLSANTRAVFSATAFFSNSVSAEFESAQTSLGLYAYSDSQYIDDEFTNDLSPVYDTNSALFLGNSASDSRLMSVSFVNGNSDNASGNLYASVVANVYSPLTATPVTAVPEPESLSLLIAGLGVLGFTISRQRKLVA